MDPRIPDKAYFRIGEVAKIAGVEPYVLRFWESEFGSLQPGKGKTNRRQYSREDVELVLTIRDLLYDQGFTIAGARKQLKTGDSAAVDAEISPRTRGALESIRNDVADLLRLVED